MSCMELATYLHNKLKRNTADISETRNWDRYCYIIKGLFRLAMNGALTTTIRKLLFGSV